MTSPRDEIATSSAASGAVEDPDVPRRRQPRPPPLGHTQHPDPPFGLARDPSRHVGFGVGIHQCIGQHVARLEAEAVITALARRVARIELTGTLRRYHNNTLRGWGPIPVRVHHA